jgi:hypothetical protein
MPSREALHAIGHVLAPKEPWNAIMEGAGLRGMVMEGRRREASGGLLRIKVEPSAKVENGIFAEINEEFRNSGAPDSDGAAWIHERLAEHWDPILKFSEAAVEHLLGLGKE